VDQLKTYANALSDYHLHPEAKFLNGDYLDRGPTARRHIQLSEGRGLSVRKQTLGGAISSRV
jgi:hypothetical protein